MIHETAAVAVDTAEKDISVIKVIGVGDSGSIAIRYMVHKNLPVMDFIAANTDWKDLPKSKFYTCLKLGPNVCKGLGASANLKIGARAALESSEEIRKALAGSYLVLIVAGLGGGTGSGAAPVIARLSKELGALTVGIVTTPFDFEGEFRRKNAKAGFNGLRKYTDAMVVKKNNDILRMVSKNSRLMDILRLSDKILYKAVKRIAGYSREQIVDLRRRD